MKKRKIDLTNIHVSTIGLGCASYWGKKQFDENKAIAIVHQAIEKGVNVNIASAVFGTTDETHLDKNLLASEIMLSKEIVIKIHSLKSKNS